MDNYLTCPKCGGNNLHQSSVLVFKRSEDAEMVVRTTVFHDSVVTSTVPNGNSGNPSSRRDGLTITFDCENCENVNLYLNIYQHKGVTYTEWADH